MLMCAAKQTAPTSRIAHYTCGRELDHIYPGKFLLIDWDTVLVYNASGERIGSGALTKRTANWGGTLVISENGSAVFEANALNFSNAILYVGRITQTLTGANDIVTIPVGLSSPKGGAIQRYVPTLSTAVNAFAGTPDTAVTGTAELPELLTNPY